MKISLNVKTSLWSSLEGQKFWWTFEDSRRETETVIWWRKSWRPKLKENAKPLMIKVLKNRGSEERIQRIRFRRSDSERNVEVQPRLAEAHIGGFIYQRTSGRESREDLEKIKAYWQTTQYGTIKETIYAHFYPLKTVCPRLWSMKALNENPLN